MLQGSKELRLRVVGGHVQGLRRGRPCSSRWSAAVARSRLAERWCLFIDEWASRMDSTTLSEVNTYSRFSSLAA